MRAISRVLYFYSIDRTGGEQPRRGRRRRCEGQVEPLAILVESGLEPRSRMGYASDIVCGHDSVIWASWF